MRFVFSKQDITILLLTLVATVACLQHGIHDFAHTILHDTASCSHTQEHVSHSLHGHLCTSETTLKKPSIGEKARLVADNSSGSIDLPRPGHDPSSCSICHFLAMAQSPFQAPVEVSIDFTLSQITSISTDAIANREIVIDSIRGPPIS